jgi:hypothetical protein
MNLEKTTPQNGFVTISPEASAPAVESALMPEQDAAAGSNEDLLTQMRPTLVIGLGGTGQHAVVHLKAILTRRFGAAWQEKVYLRAFDTTSEPIALPQDGDFIELEKGTEFVHIGQVPVGSILRNLTGLDAIRERLGSTIHRLPKTTLRNGAKQIRPLGLLALHWHYKLILETLRRAIWALAGRDILQGSIAETQSGLNVFIICSVAGGTGSGIFIDIAYLVKMLFAELGEQSQFGQITGILALPQAFHHVQGPNLLANTGAALEELNHAMLLGNFQTLYPDGRTVRITESPFHTVFVVDGVDERGNTWTGGMPQLAGMVAQAGFLLMASQLGRIGENAFDNVDHVLANRTEAGDGTFLASFGLGYIHFPAAEVVDYFSRRLAVQQAEAVWLRPPNAAAVAETTGVRLGAVKPEQLATRLMQDPETGSALRIDLPIPGWLIDTAADQVTAAAVQHIADYKHARLHDLLLDCLTQNGKQIQAELLDSWQTWVEQQLFTPTTSLPDLLAVIGTSRRRLGSWVDERRRQLGELEQRAVEGETALSQRQETVRQAANSLFLGRNGRIREGLRQLFQTAEALFQIQLDLGLVRMQLQIWNGLEAHLDELQRRINRLAERMTGLQSNVRSTLPKRRQALGAHESTRLSLAGERYLQQLWDRFAPPQVHLAELMAARLPAAQANPLAWEQMNGASFQQAVLHSLAALFQPIAEMSVEQVLSDQSREWSPAARRAQLFQMATPSWNIDRVRLPDGGTGLQRLEVLGVPDGRQTHFQNEPMLVDTQNDKELVALVVAAGAPPSALVQYDTYQQAMEQATVPIYVLPHFLAVDNQAPLAFALGSIFGLIRREGSYFYYQPADPLAEEVRLGQGLEKAIQGTASQERLAREIMERIDGQIARLGSQRSIEKLAAYYRVTPEGRSRSDELNRELKRLVRDYAEELRRLNDFSKSVGSA